MAKNTNKITSIDTCDKDAETISQPDLSALPCCPFCGSHDLINGLWSLDTGEVNAVECIKCFAGAPLKTWGQRNADVSI